MGHFAENLNLGNRFRRPPPILVQYRHTRKFCCDLVTMEFTLQIKLVKHGHCSYTET